jgi:hypothetical protein
MCQKVAGPTELVNAERINCASRGNTRSFNNIPTYVTTLRKLIVAKSPCHKFALSFRLSDEQKAQSCVMVWFVSYRDASSSLAFPVMELIKDARLADF